MTVPHLIKCPHADDGWCANCVADLGNENGKLKDDIRALRRMLAMRVGGATLYVDDGELSDASDTPAIDFRRDSPELIRLKLQDRALLAMDDAQVMGLRY